MNLENYNSSNKKQPIKKLAKEFHDYLNKSNETEGQIYWKNISSAVTARMFLTSDNNNPMISFVSNDYLGLSQNSLVRTEAIKAINKYGTGFCAAPSIGGYSSLQKSLEDGLSKLLHTEDTLIFNSGFSTNVGVLSAIVNNDDIVFLDRAVHRSVFEGVKHCTLKILPHNDIEALESTLKRYKETGKNMFVVIDGVYSQDGDIGLVSEYLNTTEKYGALLIVDDAHGIGVMGKNGAGVLEDMGILGKVPLITGTLSKAFGVIGGFVSGRKELIDYIRYYAGSCCFSVSLPPSCLASSLKSLELIQKFQDERIDLMNKSIYARNKLTAAGFTLTNSASPIIGIKTPSFEDAILWAERLLKHNIYIIPIGYPAVSKRFPRLRLALSCKHSYSDIDTFINKLIKVSQTDYQYMERKKKRRSAAEIVHLINQATQSIVKEKGFEGLSLQEICERAEIEPALFYRRYPEGLASYTEQFIRNHDFWLDNFNDITSKNINRNAEDLTLIFVSLWEKVTTDDLLNSLLRVELQRNVPDAVKDIAQEREFKTKELVETFANGSSQKTKRIQLAIITAGLQYLALHKNVSTFCGVDFNNIELTEIQSAISDFAKHLTK